MSESDASDVAVEDRVPTLPQEVIAEILARIPNADLVFLYYCGAICKPWGRLVVDPDFLLPPGRSVHLMSGSTCGAGT